MDKREAGAVATKEEMEIVERLHRKRKPADPEPVQECHYCHHGMLEKRRIGLLVFYACTNEDGCCLMFWRKPRGIAH